MEREGRRNAKKIKNERVWKLSGIVQMRWGRLIESGGG